MESCARSAPDYASVMLLRSRLKNVAKIWVDDFWASAGYEASSSTFSHGRFRSVLRCAAQHQRSVWCTTAASSISGSMLYVL
jgi:hypothetical protein